MPFYDTDNIQCWVESAFIDEYELQVENGNDEIVNGMKECVTCIPVSPMKGWIYDWLDNEIENKRLIGAIINSIDYTKMRTDLKEWIESFEEMKALDEKDKKLNETLKDMKGEVVANAIIEGIKAVVDSVVPKVYGRNA